MASAIVNVRRRILLLGSAGCYATYKAKYDPPHLIWDLDNTLLCSVTPIPPSSTHRGVAVSEGRFEFFDQIDDDFPFENGKENTRTYWRPGARMAPKVFEAFMVQHVFTAAQATYTENILEQMEDDRSLFSTVIHRDSVPQPKGKDLQKTINACRESYPNLGLDRCILFDDRARNFRPQNGENGLHVRPFQVGKVAEQRVLREYAEIARWMGIAILVLLAPDARSVLPFFRSDDHRKRFSKTERKKEDR